MSRVPGDLDEEDGVVAPPVPRLPARPAGRPPNLAEMATSIDALTGAVERLTRNVLTLADENERLATIVGQSRRPKDPKGIPANADVPWFCVKCHALIGYYDRATEIMRIRSKLSTIRGRAGVGGFLAVDCRSCGEVNSVAHTAGDGEAVAVRGGVSILDVAILEILLAKARGSGGVVEIKIVDQPIGEVDDGGGLREDDPAPS